MALCDVAVFNLTSHITKKDGSDDARVSLKAFQSFLQCANCHYLSKSKRRSIKYSGLIRADPSIAMFGKERERWEALQIGWRLKIAGIQS